MTYQEPLINSMRVATILVDCLYTNDEIGDGQLPLTMVRAGGIINDYAFNPERLEKHRDEIAEMLQNLPLQFRPASVGGGGGWSFLNACQDANDVQWTGSHRTMEHLFCLGIALDLVQWTMPKDVWPALPGGMPYVTVKV